MDSRNTGSLSMTRMRELVRNRANGAGKQAPVKRWLLEKEADDARRALPDCTPHANRHPATQDDHDRCERGRAVYSIVIERAIPNTGDGPAAGEA